MLLRGAGLLVGLALVGGCVSMPEGGRPLGRTGYGSGSFALENSNREEGILRFGDSLRMSSSPSDLALRPYTTYHFQVDSVDADGNETTMSEGDVATRSDGSVPPTTLAHDIGDMAGNTEGDADGLRVTLWDRDNVSDRYESFIPLLRTPSLQGGWNVQEVDPPHTFATDAAGTPTNAFAVSDDGAVDPGEVPAPVYVGGEGLPEIAVGQRVDVYVVRDRDTWQRQAIPQAGDADHVAGPVPVAVNADGSLARTEIWRPGLNDVGIYDVMVDVDQNGIFDWELGNKDGVDGEAKVGITIQYSQAWVRARRISHIIMNIAFDSDDRGGNWTNTFAGSDSLFVYVNPDVTIRPDLNHKHVRKWIVRHADFDAFWNNPANEVNGCVDFGDYVLGNFQVPGQEGCTNAPPLHVGQADNINGTMNGPGDYDVVFTFDPNGRDEPLYCRGADILDIVSADTFETLIMDIADVPVEQRVGFTVQ